MHLLLESRAASTSRRSPWLSPAGTHLLESADLHPWPGGPRRTTGASEATLLDENLEWQEILRNAKTVAVVGLSTDPTKDSHTVAAYLQSHGYRIVPVNPRASHILGERCYPDLLSVPVPVDVVDVFRPSEEAPAIVEQAIAIGARAIWMQVGIAHPEAAEKARQAGLKVVMDACMQMAHLRLSGLPPRP